MFAGDPRAIINPLIIPWWIYTPCRMRKAIHVLATGTPLPPDGCRKFLPRSIFARTHRRRSQTSNVKQRQTSDIERQQTGNFRQRQTSDVERQTGNFRQRQALDVEPQTLNIELQTSNIERQTPNIKRQTLNNERQTSNNERQTSDVERQTSDFEQQKSFLRRPSHQQRRKPSPIFKRKSQVVN
jgi:hypothetical protein